MSLALAEAEVWLAFVHGVHAQRLCRAFVTAFINRVRAQGSRTAFVHGDHAEHLYTAFVNNVRAQHSCTEFVHGARAEWHGLWVCRSSCCTSVTGLGPELPQHTASNQ